MQVLFACLADHASSESAGGKLNIMGVFDTIGSKAFPAAHPKMVLVVRLLLEHEDNNKQNDVVIALRDQQQQKEMMTFTGQVKGGTVQPGNFATSNLMVELNGIVFAQAGRYHFSVKVGKNYEVRVPLQVVQG